MTTKTLKSICEIKDPVKILRRVWARLNDEAWNLLWVEGSEYQSVEDACELVWGLMIQVDTEVKQKKIAAIWGLS